MEEEPDDGLFRLVINKLIAFKRKAKIIETLYPSLINANINILINSDTKRGDVESKISQMIEEFIKGII